MMSLFSSPFCITPAETSFTPLFRLLDDFESYQQQLQSAQQQPQNTNVTQRQQRRQAARAPLPTFRPRFDVRETENTYELHGELAGLDRENVEIEFTDPQTLVVRGRVERTYENKPEQKTEQETAAPTEAVTEEEKRRNSYQATVEDDPEEPSTPVQHTPPESPRAKPADKQQQVQKAQQPKAPAVAEPKYWAFERSVGEFSRTFSFPARVEHDNVSASLENGILTVTVPKAKKHEVRRIAIN